MLYTVSFPQTNLKTGNFSAKLWHEGKIVVKHQAPQSPKDSYSKAHGLWERQIQSGTYDILREHLKYISMCI